MRSLSGLPTSEGIAIGPAWVYRPKTVSAARRPVADSQAELARFEGALESARQRLGEVHQLATTKLDAHMASIFEAQQMFLEDPALIEAVTTQIQAGVNAEAAIVEELEKFALTLAGSESEYLRERAADVRDVGQHVLRALAGVDEAAQFHLDAPSVVIALDLSPADTMHIDKAMLLGIATAHGGPTSHTAILARTLGLPAVVSLGAQALDGLIHGAIVVLDGQAGVLCVEPDAAILDDYRAKQTRWRAKRDAVRAAAHEPAVTHDGRRVEVVANIGDVASAKAALAAGAEGVGLLRTEFLFLERDTLPDEETQFAAYRAIAEVMGMRPLIIRTLDVGGDKPPRYLDLGHELNPFLGWRAIRICLAQPEMFKTQLRAILRAGVGCNVKLMFPMIATVEEVRAAKQLLDEARAELRARGATFAEAIEVGIMIEIPSAAMSAPFLAREVDFFSIGTNDLIQYTLAVDRTNERVSYLYDSLNPAVLRLIQHVIESAHQAGKWVGLCGEMAGELDATVLLLGFGLDEFSMNASAIGAVKQRLRTLDTREAQALAARALTLATGAEIRTLVKQNNQRVKDNG